MKWGSSQGSGLSAQGLVLNLPFVPQADRPLAAGWHGPRLRPGAPGLGHANLLFYSAFIRKLRR